MSKLKFFFLFILFLVNLNAEVFKETIFEGAYISIDGKNYTNLNDIKSSQLEKKQKKVFFKIKINKEKLQDKIYYLRLSINPENFLGADIPYIIKNENVIIRLDKNIKDSFILNFDFKNHLVFFEVNLFNQFEYENILGQEKILFGVAYGIIICAFLYNFVFFLYNKHKSFLYYSLLQISLLLLLLATSMDLYLFHLYEKYGEIVDFLITSLINMVFIMSVLFNMEFLNTKKRTPKIHKFLWFLLAINFLDIFILLFTGVSPLFDYTPAYLFILFLLFSAFMVLKTGYTPALFYIVGWLCLFIFVFLAETSILGNNETYLLHFGIPLESLLFSFALGFKMRQTELEKQQNETILINQSKLASMGEMLGNIAHQWRQPLTHLSYIIMNLKAAFENDKLDKSYIQKKTQEATKQIEFMSQTIEDFKNFFKVSKQKEEFSLVSCINESMDLLKESFKALDIKLEFTYKEDIKIKSFKGEFSQVIFNLLNNAKEELIKRKIQNPEIYIKLEKKDKSIFIEVYDNAGGIDEKIIKKIFEPYFTTKEKGLGIGLYMSKIIIEKNINAKLEVENIKEGAKFTITI